MEVFSMVVALLSGVAMFLYGMMLMGDALKLVAGNKLEAFLYKMTNTPLKGVALGAGVTCVIQSSSATTVMVIGFVNSMMMKLRQAIGIIMGANIGTSITGWILCLSYIDGSSGIAKILSTATITAVVAVIQSASAAVGVLQALSVTGILTFASAFPIVLGIGVGAACPVLISGISANKNGKRTALVYLMNDLFGMVFWGIAFYAVNAVVHFTFMDMIMTPVSVALINTIFRVATVCVLFPFIPKLEALVCRIVKDTKEEMEDESDFDLLDERLVTYPAVAIGQCHRVMAGMAKKVRKNVNRALNLLNDFQPDKYEKVQRKEE